MRGGRAAAAGRGAARGAGERGALGARSASRLTDTPTDAGGDDARSIGRLEVFETMLGFPASHEEVVPVLVNLDDVGERHRGRRPASEALVRNRDESRVAGRQDSSRLAGQEGQVHDPLLRLQLLGQREQGALDREAQELAELAARELVELLESRRSGATAAASASADSCDAGIT